MPDSFATAVWVNPAAICHCRTLFPKRDTPLPLLALEVWCGSPAKRVPDIMDCRDDKGCFVCKQYFPEHQHILA